MTRLIDFHRIDGRLPVLGSDDNQSRFVNALAFQSLNHLAQCCIGFLQPISKNIRRVTGTVQVAAGMPAQLIPDLLIATWIRIVTCHLLPNADGLEVHAKKCWNSWPGRSVVLQAIDLVNDSFHLLLIILNCAHNADRGIESVISLRFVCIGDSPAMTAVMYQ